MAGKLNELRGRRSRRWWLAGATLTVLAISSVIFVAASGANLASSNFEGSDGNLVVDTNGNTDWANVAGLHTLTDTATGPADNSFTGGTHEDDPNVTIAAGSIPPNKNDLQRAYSASETIGGETFLYLAWERLKNIGSANIDFELNQATTPNWDASTTGALTVVRTEGDILITYDFGGSGNPDLGLLTWLMPGNGHADSDCEASGGKLPCWGNRVDLGPTGVPSAVGAVNPDTIDEPIIGGGATLTAGLFGEAKIDLSLIPGLFTQDTCKAFGSMFVKSRSSGSSIDSELKDFIAPAPIHVSNCATLNVVKKTVGGDATFPFSSTGGLPDPAVNGNFSLTTAGGTKSQAFNGLENGDYSVTEGAAPAGWSFTSAACVNDDTQGTVGTISSQTASVSLTRGESVTCTFTNTRQATLTVNKVLAPSNDPGKFNLQIDGNTAGTGANVGNNGTTGAIAVTPGSHTVGETAGTGTSLGNYVGVISGDCAANGSVTVAPGDSKVCTITNTLRPGHLTLVKHVTNDNGGDAVAADWTLTATGAGNDPNSFSGAGGAGPNVVTPNVVYTLTESAGPSGYTASAFDCTGGGTQVANTIKLAPGDNVTCTITNDDVAPTITVTKVVVPSTDKGTFNFTINGNLNDNGTDGYGNGDSTGAVPVSAGDQTITESGNGNTNLSDYSSQWTCSGVDGSHAGTTINLSSVGVGENVTCTFTNTKLATLIVVKKVDNSNGGGSKGAGDFTIHVTGDGFAMAAAGSSSGTTYSGLLPGLYTVSEDAVAGYNLTGISGCLADGSVMLEAGATVTCTLTNTSNAPPPPPPPPPPAPRIDLAITKTAAPNPATVGNAITWTMVVTNNGPSSATGVTVADPLPAGTSFVSVATTQGSCTGGALISCQLGSMPVGTSVTITLVTTATATGTITNTATTVGNEQETNTANNTASASTVVNGVFTPPVQYCTALAVSPKSILVGKSTLLTLRISQHKVAKAGVKVRIKGSTVLIVTKPSNRKGIVTQRVNPKKAGMITFVPLAKKGCSNPRIGVIGVFTPPVTG
jgi:uncharacterized repeat protein (TIGR01451 family)